VYSYRKHSQNIRKTNINKQCNHAKMSIKNNAILMVRSRYQRCTTTPVSASALPTVRLLLDSSLCLSSFDSVSVSTVGGELLGVKTVEWMATNHLPEGKTMAEMPAPNVGYSELAAPGTGFGLGFAVVENPTVRLSTLHCMVLV
jgi:hypothetical protein